MGNRGWYHRRSCSESAKRTSCHENSKKEKKNIPRKRFWGQTGKKKKPEKKSALNAKVKGRKNDTQDSIQVRFIDTSVRYFWCWCIHLHQEAKNAKPASPRNDRNHADRSKYPQ